MPEYAEQSVTVQCVLYNNDVGAIERALESLNRCAELAVPEGAVWPMQVAYGDASRRPLLDTDVLEAWAERFPSLRIRYEWFGRNTGSALGHNLIAEHLDTDLVLIMNPDVVLAPRALGFLIRSLDDPLVGMAEAKQLPIEHPKDYDPVTGETMWATTACALIPRDLFVELGGFDSDTFFMYCDDVDFSWRVRLAGRLVVFQPAATVFHDKRLGDDGQWQPTSAEQYYSAEAGLLLAHKWSRDDLVEKIAGYFRSSKDETLLRAVAEYERRRLAGLLAPQVDSDHVVGVFTPTNEYAKHRYLL
ncbi:hypothetical protein [Cryobacterium sp. GrIS_2_6]|uniref:hypothetical protein n=1 Tax=Cryobacterium sp. GrIS_2_6 TaxID=3162785 RepID=UPI002E036148|nr:GT2 family glycosyltransferase [Cryobacterium psychrotolerans]